MVQYRYERLQPEYARLWAQMHVTKTAAAIAQARKIIAAKPRYQAVAATTGVPWFVVGCLHMRESSARFDTWLHNGDPMRDRAGRPVRTVHRPPGRPPDPDVSWEDGAYDALVTCEGLDQVGAWCPERVAYAAELFNGFGYRNPSRNIPSPYLWGGTDVQKPGKFVEDGEYRTRDEHGRPLWDPQIGVMAMLKELLAIDPEAAFAPAEGEPAPEPVPLADPRGEGRAIDVETMVKPLARSRTILGGFMSWLSGIAAAVAGFFDKLDNPYTLAAFIALLVVACVALWLIVSGRINVQRVVAHLSEDDTEAAGA